MTLPYTERPFTRELICAYDVYEELKAAFPKRAIIPAAEVEAGVFYYFAGKDGLSRRVKVKDRSIWICDTQIGFPYMRRVR